MPQTSDRNYIIMLVLSFFFGGLGIDRFYAGKIGTGILKLLTIGGLGLWWLIDLIIILVGGFRDAGGRPIKP